MAISTELADVYLGNPHGVHFIEAIDLAHPALPFDLHFTNYTFSIPGLVDNLGTAFNTYVAVPFIITQPSKTTAGNQALELSFSNVNQQLVSYVNTMAEAPQDSITLTFRVFLTTQVDAAGSHINQLNPPWTFEVSSVGMNAQAAIMQATKLNTHNRSFPRVRYRRDNFPGLAR